MKLTLFSKVLITLIVLGGAGFAFYKFRDKIAPPAPRPESSVPPVAELPDTPDPTPSKPTGDGKTAAAPTGPEPGAGCTDRPEVRLFHWAWNAQAGMMLATGGKQATAGSLMCKHGVNLRLIREDDIEAMQSQLATFAERLKGGEAHPAQGGHFVAIMGDGAAAFLKELNDRLAKLGPDYVAVVVGSAGYSRGEDKFMGPPEWKANPQAARGGVVAGVLRDGDWNIALKWLGDNRIPNNPDETAYDPDALNWIAASDYLDAGQKYISGYCADLRNVKTGKKERKCVQGVVTWTPGDVNVAQQKGGLVSIVSTKEYRSQMPNVIIGNKRWMAANPQIVQGMLSAIFEGGDQIKQDRAARRRAAQISALVYGENDADYWDKYFDVQVERDKQGLMVELGGSSVNNLADNLHTFGLAPGSTNIFAATYTVFGNIVKSQYPNLMPDFHPAEKVQDLTYLKALQAAVAEQPPERQPEADLPKFEPAARVTQVVSRRSWDIQFETGSARFTNQAESSLRELLDDLVIAGGTLVEIHGHTDNVGNVDKNQQLSEERAFAVKRWLEQQSAANFPQGRVKVFAHGQTQPIESNANPDGRAKNRRVEIVLGTAK